MTRAWIRHPTPGWIFLAVLLAAVALPVRAAAPQMFDDFEDGDLEASSGLSWVVLTDEQFGGTSHATAEVVDGGAAGSGKSLHFQGETTEEARIPVASVWAPVGKDGLAKDLSAYQGIRFFARGDGGSFTAGARRGTSQVANFAAPFTAPQEWTHVEVPFAELKQVQPAMSPQEWSAQDVLWIGFSVAPGFIGPFDLEIDQVELY